MPSIAPEQTIHVAVGVVQNARAEILISKRHDHLHQGGLWEFPGGKFEQGEDCFTALRRELHEELGITIESTKPLIQIPFRYPDRTVLLDVLQVTAFSGIAEGLEGQAIQWAALDELDRLPFPAANRRIIRRLQLPNYYLITGQHDDRFDFFERLRHGLEQGIKLVQLRNKSLSNYELESWVAEAKTVCQTFGAHLLVNTTIELARKLDVGLHLSSHYLMNCNERPVDTDQWLAASVHNEAELRQANKLAVDFIVLSPVLPTSSHPDAPTLGWERFSELVEQSLVPVYALGGMTEDTLTMAQQSGAQGIAAISAFWKKL